MPTHALKMGILGAFNHQVGISINEIPTGTSSNDFALEWHIDPFDDSYYFEDMAFLNKNSRWQLPPCWILSEAVMHTKDAVE